MSNSGQNQETRTEESGCGQMKSHKANLEIEIGGDGKDGGHKTITRFYNSAVLANKSNYIDTMLASEMKESETYKISFSDTPVKTFDRALQFVLDPVQARKMTAKDVVAVAKFYDQYDFADGRDLCEHVLLEYFESLPGQEEDISLDVDLMVEAVAVSIATNLTLARQKGSEYIKEKTDGNCLPPFNQRIFSQDHVKTLIPVIADLVEEDNSYLKWVTGTTLDNDTIGSPLFPKLFTAQAMVHDASGALLQGSLINVSGSGITDVDGDFAYSPGKVCFFRNCLLRIDDISYLKVVVTGLAEAGGWEIRAQNGNQSITLWKAKYSASSALPPMQNWEPVHQLAEGSSLVVQFKKPAMGLGLTYRPLF